MPDAEMWKLLGEIRGEMSAHSEEHRRIEHSLEEMQLTMQQHMMITSRVDAVEKKTQACADTLADYDKIKNRGIGLALGGAGLFGGGIATLLEKLVGVFK